MRLGVALLVLAASALHVDAGQRSSATRTQFQREHPCPSTGRTSGACPGYVKDHVVPLCAGGPDQPSNMQWQTTQDAKVKDRAERAQCRR